MMNNDAIRGYIVLALQDLGCEDIIEEFLNTLQVEFDTITTLEAEQYYCSNIWKNKK